MRVERILLLTSVFTVQLGFAQVGINTEEPKATLHIDAKDAQNPDSSAGILIPRVERNPDSGNEKGQLIFNSTEGVFYFWNGVKWMPLENNGISQNGAGYFAETKDGAAISIDNNSEETVVPNTQIEFSLSKTEKVQFTSAVNFKGRSSAFAPLFKLKLTNKTTGKEEFIDKASNTFLSDGISDYYGNLQLVSLKSLPAGDYKAEVVAGFNNCCDFNFIYEVGGDKTPVSLLVQYK